MTDTTTLTRERTDLLESLRRHRAFLRFTVQNLTDEQATTRPTVSALNLAGLIKHVSAMMCRKTRRADQRAPGSNHGASGSAWSASRSAVATRSSVCRATSS